ncbi:tRNA (adenosine(37)-N6)-dimethylallyltransferase MiaA [Pedobacter sp. ASV28]|uniref:tRNA (adenosine(37)-N6)-dimethylallyltransferase MiaA n=1 Tax=Pedobacter sp. ASV28 TaxID=2795123 RepID=UPI0018EBB193|nr:tRNA (adenosine(37)-N6)-dimethylallyltransferase MiaA [Pedobacter sp. ASV28]
MSEKNLLIILGATASGKTNLAAYLAHRFNGEIISADSRQVFRGMDIGTGKDLGEYRVGEINIPYHLIDIKDAGERYQVNAFKNDFYQAFEHIKAKNKLPILCGGTGMYIHSILQNHELTAVPVNFDLRQELQLLSKDDLQKRLNAYPEHLRKHADYSSLKRLVRAIEIADFLSYNDLDVEERAKLVPVVIGLVNKVEIRRKKIIERLDYRLANGLIEEVELLLKKGVSEDMINFYGLEYKFVMAHLNGTLSLAALKERLGVAICQFAKRQMTFFRKMEKDGVQINWITVDDDKRLSKNMAEQLIQHEFDLK